jgi:hypothetical protein
MKDEPIRRYCCVCGKKLPGTKTVYELIEMGAASKFGDAQLIFHCIAKHTKEQIQEKANTPPPFRIAVLPKRGEQNHVNVPEKSLADLPDLWEE